MYTHLSTHQKRYFSSSFHHSLNEVHSTYPLLQADFQILLYFTLFLECSCGIPFHPFCALLFKTRRMLTAWSGLISFKKRGSSSFCGLFLGRLVSFFLRDSWILFIFPYHCTTPSIVIIQTSGGSGFGEKVHPTLMDLGWVAGCKVDDPRLVDHVIHGWLYPIGYLALTFLPMCDLCSTQKDVQLCCTFSTALISWVYIHSAQLPWRWKWRLISPQGIPLVENPVMRVLWSSDVCNALITIGCLKSPQIPHLYKFKKSKKQQTISTIFLSRKLFDMSSPVAFVWQSKVVRSFQSSH